MAPAAVGLLAAALVTVGSAVGADRAPAGAEPSAAAQTATAHSGTGGRHWVNIWTAMPQLTEPGNMPPAPFTQENLVLDDTTLRQTVRVATGGDDGIRLRFSNAFGGAALPITAVSVARPLGGRAGTDAVEPGSTVPVTFSGRESISVPVGAQVVSDPIDLRVAAGTDLSVSVYLRDGQASGAITSHPGSRTTSYLLAGDHTGDEALPGATPVDHWYFLSGVEALSGRGTSATAVLGDSLTDGRGSTTNGNDRWPDQLQDRLLSGRATRDVAVLNQAAGGNRVLDDGLGPNALARLDRDVLATSGVTRLIVFEGVNDIGTAAATEEAQRRVTDDLITAYDQIVERAHAQGIEVYGATLLPFGNNAGYDDPAGLREEARLAVNDWIRHSGRFDAVIDFDRAVRDPAHPERLLPDVHDGDWLHLTPEGYGLLAAAVPDRLFR
ncbi:SGNH/GDSL hydrolase family protein [Streptomyces sp. RFCAC02]|uniref:SGNH/GDSL hydrolase family protein n=1 Tax=Streptomyces sp. RFCAC02 TaxID=2499143 RepID=UPI00101F52CA|nr:SGNH/GDSL hydrolase family protein [Streptomyces sp. RFCAC02]